MKKFSLLLVSLILIVGTAAGAVEEVMNRENLSLKAGPTEPGENLALVWVEALVYPKVVKGERMISLGVRVTSPIEAVKATFDFTSKQVALSSVDRMSWSGVYTLPENMEAGVHLVRYKISKGSSAIQRTVEFFVETEAGAFKGDLSQKESLEVFSWPLTVLSSCTAFSNDGVRFLNAGQKLTGVSKIPWYKVVFDDGKEGWISSTDVVDPTEDYYYRGYEAYKAKNFSLAVKYYRDAVTVNPGFVKGYLWLAKSYDANGDLDSAVKTIHRALQLDDRDMESRLVAASLAQKCFLDAHNKFRAGRYQEAVASFRKVLDLKPDSSFSWIKMGESLERLGLTSEARSAWREALKHDPENSKLRALLSANYRPSRPATAGTASSENISQLMADDSLKIVKEDKTSKGTKIEAAIKSVVAVTRSLGTPIVEKGWQIRRYGEKILVQYLCEQGGGVLESFDWLVDVDTRKVLPHNENARLLMSRW